MLQIGTVRTHKAWDGLRIYIPRMVLLAARIKEGSRIGLFVDEAKPGELIVRKV
jgi:hypothetical protein